jgi:hypothetical protein
MKLFALLIGINEYSRDSVSPILSLQACLNDVAHIKAFLKANYSDLIHCLISFCISYLPLHNACLGYHGHFRKKIAS